MIFDAIKLVAGAHYGQFRKGTNLPYIVHPLNVMTILINSGCSNEVITAGILHDVIEDSEVSIDEIKDQFGAKVAALVTGASENRDNFDENDGKSSWKQRKQYIIEFLIHEADFE